VDRVGTLTRSRLHGIFSGDPVPALALRVTGGLWSIVEWTLTLTPDVGDPVTFDLREYSIHELGEAILAAGFGLPYEDTFAGHLGAIVLMEGSGDPATSNGDHLDRHDSLLWCWLGAVGLAFEDARSGIPLALAQMVLPDAGTIWADLFGETFGIARWPDETDTEYTARLAEEVTRKRSSPAAMLRNIRRITGEDLAIREPWKEIFALGVSALGGPHYLQGAPIYEYHTAQIVSDHGGVDWSAVTAEASADRPAGTMLLGPATHFPTLSFVSSETLLAIAFYREECRYRYARGASYGWTGTWDDRAWSADVVEFPIGPPYDS